MVAGFLLVLAVLVLGGVIATIGDRMGTKIGKARLSLFNLRPRDTAVLVTIFTGVMIAGVSTALILLVSEQARVAFFKYDQLQADMADARRQKDQAQIELAAALAQRAEAEKNLAAVNSEFRAATTKQQQLEQQLERTRTRIRTVEAQKEAVEEEAGLLTARLALLKQQRDQLTGRIAASRASLGRLGKQLTVQVLANQTLGRLFDDANRSLDRTKQSEIKLRVSDVLFQKGETLLNARIEGGLTPELAQSRLIEKLSLLEIEVRKVGAKPLDGDLKANAVLIKPEEVRNLVRELVQPGDHALSIIAKANSVEGEPVQVEGRVAPNRLLFPSGRVMASLQFNPDRLLRMEDPREPFVALFNEASRKARDAGIFTRRNNKVGEFSAVDIEMMLEDLKNQPGDSPITIQAIARRDIYTVGPLQLTLMAIQDGRVISKAGDPR